MKRTVYILFVVLCVMTSSAISGCVKTGGPNSGSKQNSGSVVNVFNWGLYLDESILDDFNEETGIKVNYSEFQSNEEMYSILKSGGANYDVIIPSDYMISRMINEDMLEELDFSNIPNYTMVDDIYKDLEYDPEGKYSVAYMSGTVGIIYNTKQIKDNIRSWGSLFDSRYSGQILMFNNPRDAFGIALKYLGYSQNTTDTGQIQEAYALLSQQKPMLQAYVMDQIFDKLESGEAAIGPYYAGDYLIMKENNPDLAFMRPAEGSNWFVDAMCIPKGAKNKTNAEIFIDYMCKTDVALKNMEFVCYASTNFEAAEIYGEDLDPDEYEIMFASYDTLAKCDIFTNLPQETLALYDQLWVELKK
ncbi:MAG: spermidine/putrescine ABC transporter substrate-binding protein [Oscillospiraceae bacterium]|nr:spermidine/putrescine ABC transporter substrate-binding protein [Oscillospiraceae bacterium]